MARWQSSREHSYSFHGLLHESPLISFSLLDTLSLVRTRLSRMQQPRMILRNHTYLKVYKCWRILPIQEMQNGESFLGEKHGKIAH